MWTPVKSTVADVCGFVSPVALALLVVVATRRLGADEAPLLWKLLLEVLVDVAHVYGTLCRTVLDSEATALNWRLYLLAVPGLLLPTLFVNIVFGTWLGWSLLSYYAMFHFAKQPFGLLCIYKARQGERDPKEHQLDYWTCLAGAGLPLLQWHAGDFPDFAWFGGEEAQRLSQKTARSAASAALPKVKLNKAAPLVARPRDEETLFDILTGMQIHAARDRQVRAKERPVPGADADAPDAVEDAPADNVVDDLLGDLLAVEGAGAATAFEAEDPKATALGPQLCLDEQGNIVLNQSSLSRNVSQPVPVEESATVQEAVSQYASAYKKTPACKWTEQETDLFYEALSLYGTDLFLVQTFFRNKSAGQIKTKYQKEMRKNPKRVEEALTERAQKLTKDTFEKLHGKIDVSKHYKPPPSPQPGDEPEAHEPEIDEDMAELGGMPPPEPEYSAEDESLTTNRLMALFD